MANKSKCLRYLALSASIIAGISVVAAQALAAEGQPSDQDAPVAAAKDQRKDQTTTQLETVTVTATKRTENERTVPESISVLTEEQLQQQHVTRLSDLNGYVPSLRIEDNGSPGQTSVSLRGIPTVGAGALIGTYIGDTPLGSSNNFLRGSQFVLDLFPYDIAQIEVLRGPQGTLYGGNTMGGLLKYVLSDPDLESADARFGAGVFGIQHAGNQGWDDRLGINLPLIKDQLGIRASFSDYSTPGWVDNTLSHQADVNSVRQQGAHLTGEWKPNEDVKLTLTYLRQVIDSRDNNTVTLDVATRQPLYGSYTTSKSFFEPFKTTTNYYTGALNWDLHWADLLYATSYSKTATHQLNDATPAYGSVFPRLGPFPTGTSYFGLDLGLKKWTQELRLTSKSGGRVEWLLGAFYTNEDSTNHQILTALTDQHVPIAGLDPLLLAEIPASYRESALFGDLTYRFTDAFDFSAGVRTASNDQKFSQIVQAGTLAAHGTATGRSSEDVFTYQYGPRYHLGEDSILYARVASGYRPGGPNFALPNVPPSVRSDTLVNYELGLKATTLNHRLDFDIAAYQIDWKKIQTGASTPNGLTYFVNANGARSRGGEIELKYLLSQHLQVGFTGAYTDSQFTSPYAPVAVKVGDPLPGIPRWTGSFVTNYYFSLPGDWSGRAGAAYGWTGARNSSTVADPANFRLGSYGALNMNAEFSKGAWTISVYGKNLANDRTYLNIAPLMDVLTRTTTALTANQLQPRTIGVEVDLHL